jgi:hypothetical protein
MKRLLVFLSLFMILASTSAFAENKPQQNTPGTPEQEPAPVIKKYVIHLKDGGSMETTNYTYEGNKVKVVLPAGFISLDRSMILKIVEVKGEDDGTVQKIFRLPAGNEGAKTPSPATTPEKARAPREEGPAQPTDDLGHTQLWWKTHVKEWEEKLEDAQIRHTRAQEDWNKYNGLLNTLGTGVSPYQVTQYQDLRGAARVEMDRAQADMDEAKKMLDEVIPDEARKAGAPPGWAR